MARQKRRKLTTSEAIEKIELQGLRNMTLEELKDVGRPLMKVVRERIRRLEQAELRSPAYIGYKEDLKMKSTINLKDRNKLLSEVYNAYVFLEKSKTSTVREARAYKARMENILGAKLTDKETEAVWDVFHRIKTTNPQAFQKYGYDQVISLSVKSSLHEDFNVDLALQNLEEEFNSLAELEFEDEDSIWSIVGSNNAF